MKSNNINRAAIRGLAIIVILFFTITGCCRFNKTTEQSIIPECISDTINRPDYVSPKASYIVSVGGYNEPCFIYWAEYIGSAKINNKVYSHIKEVHVFKSKTDIDTLYLENMKLRSGNIVIDDKNTKIAPVSNGDGLWRMSLISGEDKIAMFYSYDQRRSTEFGKIHVSTISYNERCNEYVFDHYKELIINIKDEIIMVDLMYGEVEYKLGGKSKLEDVSNGNVCYVNNENGRIHFLEKDCYIEPVRLQDWRAE